ncbi:polyadenylate-binding protein 4-like protein, partial [Tanacetum coccineum]
NCAFGNVVVAKVIRHKEGLGKSTPFVDKDCLSKAFGFKCFSNPKETKNARDSLNGNDENIALNKNSFIASS